MNAGCAQPCAKRGVELSGFRPGCRARIAGHQQPHIDPVAIARAHRADDAAVDAPRKGVVATPGSAGRTSSRINVPPSPPPPPECWKAPIWRSKRHRERSRVHARTNTDSIDPGGMLARVMVRKGSLARGTGRVHGAHQHFLAGAAFACRSAHGHDRAPALAAWASAARNWRGSADHRNTKSRVWPTSSRSAERVRRAGASRVVTLRKASIRRSGETGLTKVIAGSCAHRLDRQQGGKRWLSASGSAGRGGVISARRSVFAGHLSPGTHWSSRIADKLHPLARAEHGDPPVSASGATNRSPPVRARQWPR